MASVGKRQEKQARDTMKLREIDSKKQECLFPPYLLQYLLVGITLGASATLSAKLQDA